MWVLALAYGIILAPVGAVEIILHDGWMGVAFGTFCLCMAPVFIWLALDNG